MKKLRTAFSALKKWLFTWAYPMKNAQQSQPGGRAYPPWWEQFVEEELGRGERLAQGELPGAKSWKNYGHPIGGMVPIGAPKIIPQPPSPNAVGAATAVNTTPSADAKKPEAQCTKSEEESSSTFAQSYQRGNQTVESDPSAASKNASFQEYAKEPLPPRQSERVIFENPERLREILSYKVGQGIAFYDPQCDEPLDDNSEKNMNELGAANFLRMLCVEYELNITPIPTSEWECERAARKAVRTKVLDWSGERFVQ